MADTHDITAMINEVTNDLYGRKEPVDVVPWFNNEATDAES